MVQIEGKYKLEKSENFDEFLKELGVNYIGRSFAKNASPTVTIKIDGDFYMIKIESTIKSSEIKFKLGEEFDETRMDGKVVKSIFTKENENILIQIQKGDKEVKYIREFSDDGMKLICQVNGVTCTRFFKRI